MKNVVFNCNDDDSIPFTGQILFTDYGSGLHHLAWRETPWDSWSPPLVPTEVEIYEPVRNATPN